MALSTTQYGYIIDPMVPFTDEKGKTIKNGFVRVFVAGSSTPVVTYRNFDGAANQDLIELDNSGRTKTSVIGSKGLTYKVCVYDKHHSQETPILTVDKVSVIGANITAGAGATVVTGLDGLTTKPDGFVDASVIGTDGYVALDHTLVDDDLDTDAKATAVENDRYIPLLNEDVNDPDSKMTLGRLWQWVLGHIKSLSTTITAFRTGDVIPVDGPLGTAKMSKDDLLREVAENAGAVGYINKADFSVEKKYPVIGDNLLVSDGTNKIALPYEEPIQATQKNFTKYGNGYFVAASAINDEGKVYGETWWRLYYYPCKNGDIINLYVNNTSRLNFGFNSVVPSVGDTIDSYAGQVVLSSPKTITFRAREDGYFLVSAHVAGSHTVVISETDETIGVKVEKEFLNLYDESSVTWNQYINSNGGISSTSGYDWGVTDFIPFNGKPISFTESGRGSYIPNAAIYDKFYNLVKVVPTGTSQIEYRSEYKFVRINVYKASNICIKYGITSDLSTYLNTEKLPGLDDIGNGLKKILRGVFDVSNENGFANDYEHNKLVFSRNSAVEFDTWSQFVKKITSWDGTKIIIEFDLAIPTLTDGTYAALWVTDGYSSSYVAGHQDKLATFHNGGHYRFEIDTAYYAVYRGWTTFNFWLVCSGITHDTAVDNIAEFSNLFVWCYTEDRKEFNNFNGENLSGLLAGVDEAIDNLVSGQSKSDFIVSPNGTKFIQSIDNSGNIFGIPLFPNKTAFIGNSLLFGNVTFGMNASDSEHDYYYYLTTYITGQNPSAEFVKIYGSPLEHSTTITEARQQIETIVADIPADAELVQIQMGDNVNTDTKREVFNTSCSEFISAVRAKAPRARIIWVGTWYNSTIRSFISNTCASLGVQWVPIGSFNKAENQSYVGAVIHRSGSATRTLANVTNVTEVSSGRISVTFTDGANSYMSELDVSAWSITGTTLTYTSEYSITDSTGVATHPGNNGFRLIANKILFDTKMAESENTYPAAE